MNLPYAPVEGFDLAALLPEIYGAARPATNPEKERPVLGVSVCNYEQFTGGDMENERRREARIIEALKAIAGMLPLKIVFHVFNGHQDYGDDAQTRRVQGILSDHAETELVGYFEDPGAMWRSVGSCDAFLATRLHAGIFSCFAEVPFLQVEYHPKCSDFLSDIDYPDQSRIGDMERPPAEIGKLLFDMLSGDKNPVATDVSELKQKAARNFTSVPVGR